MTTIHTLFPTAAAMGVAILGALTVLAFYAIPCAYAFRDRCADESRWVGARRALAQAGVQTIIGALIVGAGFVMPHLMGA